MLSRVAFCPPPITYIHCFECFKISKQLSPPLQEDGLSPREQELKGLKESLQDTQPVGVLVDCCRTMDQVRTGRLLAKPLYFCKDQGSVPVKLHVSISDGLNNPKF